ncbi:hypothetical protein [Yonghaparkia sp. Soil809]|uniref:hypothetical protein n=1 Tax=Yonghaparkia sp. Soil809 TaxID=1736417 RepID=UPI0006FE440E|nr:hypothetical protein [Yonghaparkia sp. Soil809]KRF31113.1 hypothetical protein ASG83_09845 [Yonghaparkia sp. Soil809]
MVTTAHETDEVAALARSILDLDRRRPLVVVTTVETTTQPLVDVLELEQAISPLADIVIVPTGDRTRELELALPNNCATFGGAVRSFPIGDEWRSRPSLARRRFSFSLADGPRVLEEVVIDVIGMAHRAGLIVATPRTAEPAAGVIASILAGGERALVRLDGDGLATVSVDAVLSPAPLPWFLASGMRVSGFLDPESRRLSLDLEVGDGADLWSRFPDCSVTLALVHRVERQRAVLLIHPQHPVTVTRSDLSTNPLDRVDLLLTEGDVIEVRVTRDEQGRRALRTVDLNDDEVALPAIPLVPGGPPWLEPGRTLVEADETLTSTPIDELLSVVESPTSLAPAPASGGLVQNVARTESGAASTPLLSPTHPRPGPGAVHVPSSVAAPAAPLPEDAGPTSAPNPTASRSALHTAQGTIAALQAELRMERARRDGPTTDQLRRELAATRTMLGQVHRESQHWHEQAERATARVKETQAALRDARRESIAPLAESPRSRRARFDAAEDWIRHELYLQWIERFDPATRAEHPLPAAVTFGPRFAASVEALSDPQLSKALRCALEAVTGFIRRTSAREVHALRSGDGGGDRPVIRDDGARCMRAYIEQNTPQARRLHYWVLPGGEVELSRVVAHDDVEP